MSLPRPERQRWQPLRAGLVDLFYYDVEEFHFHGGSLLLRGNNGTGKSKVLALTLPFLLDGELSPHRVEPDGDRNKRMEWNLLLGGRYPHAERLGYTWLEFGRQDTDGGCHYITLGCGLKAVSGRGIAAHWFFVTDQRIGDELSLLTAARTALTQDRLREAIGTRGMVYKRAGDYRRAVDEALFGLGGRYEALVSLLIQLRQPQLSKRPDERLLSRALTEALPPLDDNLVTQVADAFRSLDDERETLRGLVEAKRAADDFLGTYRRYARIAAKRKAAGPRQQQSRYDQLGRDLGEAQRAFDQADEAARRAEGQRIRLSEGRQRLEAEQRALLDSPEARAAENLEQLRTSAMSFEQIAEKQRRAVERIEQEVHSARVAVDDDAHELGRARDASRQAESQAGKSAREARLADRHSGVAAMLERGSPPHQPAREEADRAVAWRSGSLSTLDKRLAEAAAADQTHAKAREQVDRLDSAVADADGRVLHAETAAAAQGTALVRACRAYLSGTTEISLVRLEELLSGLEAWVETLDGENPVTRAVADAVAAAGAELGRREGQLDALDREAHKRLEEVERQLRELAEGVDQAPPSAHTRRPEARQGRAGAPLWRVVDFAEGVPDADRAGIEASLEAAGILDAWLGPDGTLRSAADGDVILVAGGPAAHNLDGLLAPAVDRADAQAAALSDDLIRTALRSIGLGPEASVDTWVASTGHYQVGLLRGRWSKPSATYIGEGARERARRVRLAQLRAEREGVQATLDGIAEEQALLSERKARLIEEQRGCPTDTGVREAFTHVRTEHDARRRLVADREHAREKAREAAESAGQAHDRAAEFAAEVDLPIDPEGIGVVKEALQSYRIALPDLWHTAANAFAAAKRLADAEARLREWQQRLGPARDEFADAAQQALAARDRYETLHATVGASVAELQRRLADTKQALQLNEAGLARAEAEERAAIEARGKAEGSQAILTGDLVSAGLERDASVELLRSFASTGLLRMACPGLETPGLDEPWAATPAVLLARAVDRELSGVDDSDGRWERSQQQVANDFKTLNDGLGRHGHRAAMTPRDDIMLVDVTFQGRPRPVDDLAGALAQEIDERQRVLSAREREVLENHLVNEIAGTLQELITSAETQVGRMNDELERRPTSTGMRLRLRWRTARDAPEGLTELRGRQLRQSTDVWNEEDRRKVGAFLQEQINRERERDEAATWHEQLTRALDYRAWHEFTIERYQDGVWRSATGPASGGERVLAASVPLFAAASSYYSSAGHPHAPRLIALDEAFAGVDDDSRAKCLGLLATFDLDVVMTSEREWGCYPQVPGLAIAQLSRHDGIDAVLVTPWRWDGSERVRMPRPASLDPAP